MTNATQPPQRYAANPGRVHNLANGEALFLDESTRTMHPMTVDVLQALDACRGFHTMDEHVRAVEQRLPALQGKGEAIRAVLNNFIQRGVMIGENTYVQSWRTPSVPEAPLSPCDAVYIRAANRPQCVTRLLDSLKNYEQTFAAKRRYVVLDDSTDAAAEQTHQRAVADFAEQAGTRAVHVSAKAWRGMAEDIAKQSDDPEAVKRLLAHGSDLTAPGGGAGNNLMGLMSAGERYAKLDDDFVFDFRWHPEQQQGFVTDVRAWGIRVMPSMDAALNAGQACVEDPIAWHERVAGRRIADVLNDETLTAFQRGHADGMMPSALQWFQPDARVQYTTNGHRGHTGAATIEWLYLLDQPGFESFAADKTQYLKTLNETLVWHGVKQPMLGQTGNFTPFMIDHRSVLPVTLPEGRSEDRLFAALNQMLSPEALCCDVPMAVAHQQEGSQARQQHLEEAHTPTLNLFIGDWLKAHVGKLQAQDPAVRMRAVAATLMDWSKASDQDLLFSMKDFLSHRRAMLIENLQEALNANPQAPVHWVADVRRMVELNAKVLIDYPTPRFADMPANANDEACVRVLRSRVDLLARGLRVWPQVFDAALTLRERWWASL